MTGIYLTLIDGEDDRDKFEILYKSQREKLFRTACKLLDDRQLAEDALSETFLYIARKFSRLSSLLPEQLEAYCCITIKNICKNMLRDRPHEIYSDEEIYCNDNFISNEALRYTDNIILKDAVSKLKYEEKEILMLLYFYKFSIKEIADFKKMKKAAVQKRIQRARNKLKMLMEKG